MTTVAGVVSFRPYVKDVWIAQPPRQTSITLWPSAKPVISSSKIEEKYFQDPFRFGKKPE
jgi:hypothetical protein